MEYEYHVLECDIGITKFLVIVYGETANKLLPNWRIVYGADTYKDAEAFIADVEGEKKPN